MEFWDIYDVNRIKTGETHTRGEAMDKDSYHMVVHICIFNSKGEMLIQQRQPFKCGWSGLWDITVGGSAQKGETSQMAIERELSEEIGLKADLHDARPHLTINFDDGFDDFYFLEKDIDLDSLILQYEEVKQVKWASLEDILSGIDSGEFIPYYKSFIQLLFDNRNCYGCVRLS